MAPQLLVTQIIDPKRCEICMISRQLTGVDGGKVWLACGDSWHESSTRRLGLVVGKDATFGGRSALDDGSTVDVAARVSGALFGVRIYEAQRNIENFLVG